MHVRDRVVYRGEVLFYDGFTAFAVGLLNGVLDRRDSFVPGQDFADGEETGLHNGVDTLPHAGLLRHGVRVNDVKLNFFLNQIPLHLFGQGIPDLIRAINTVEEENRTLAGILQHVKAVHKAELVTAHKGGFAFRYQIRSFYRLGAKAQVRDRDGAGFLGVVVEVTLSVIFSFVADNLNGVFIRANGAVRAQSKEHRLNDIAAQRFKARVVGDAQMGDIILNPDNELALGMVFFQLIKDALRHGGGEVFGRQPVAPTGDYRLVFEGRAALIQSNRNRIDDILVKRFAERAGFFGAVHHRDFLHGGGQGSHQVLDGERTVQAHINHRHFFALLGEQFRGLAGCLRAGAHDNHHAFRVGRAVVFHDVVWASGQFAEPGHFLFNDINTGIVIFIYRLAPLEVNIRVLGGTAHDRRFGGQGAFAVFDD